MRPNAFEEIDRGDEGTVRDISGPVSASEDAANPADGVDDRRTRVPGLGEWAGSPVTRKHVHLLRYLTGLAFKVFAKEGTDGVQAANGEVRGIAVLQDHDDQVVIVVFVPRVRPEHLLVGDSPVELKKTVARVFERTRIGGMRVRPGGKFVDLNGAKVDSITNEVKPGDHEGVYLDDRPIIGKAIVAIVGTDGGRQGDMANNPFLFVRPIPGDVDKQLL